MDFRDINIVRRGIIRMPRRAKLGVTVYQPIANMDFTFEQISLTKKRDLHIMAKSLVGDSVGIQTQDLRNRNPALYSAKLRSHKVFAKILQNFENSKIIEWKIPIRFFMMQVNPHINQFRVSIFLASDGLC